MRVFVYEAITSGAALAPGADLAASEGLLAEGLAMVRAVTEDFAALEGVEVWGLRDSRLADFSLPRREIMVASSAEERRDFVRLAGKCEWTLIIAPELDGMLAERVNWLRETNTRLLTPAGEFLAIASSKNGTAEHLRACGVPTPATPTEPYHFPLVLKRDDGAGSLAMRLMHNQEEWETVSSSIPLPSAAFPQRRRDRGAEEEYRLEQFCPGLPVSVALLCGPAGNVPLQPCEQRLEPDTLAYLGGSTPLPQDLEKRAQSLALAAIGAMPPTVGYVGVDLVLGETVDGSQDVVIEINPRLTTSYVGLRRACRQNLAQAMLDVANGGRVELSFRKERVEFRADGYSM